MSETTQSIQDIRLRCIEAAATAIQGHARDGDVANYMIAIASKLEDYVLGRSASRPKESGPQATPQLAGEAHGAGHGAGS